MKLLKRENNYDYGLKLRPEIEKVLLKSLKSKKRIPVEEVAVKLRLKW